MAKASYKELKVWQAAMDFVVDLYDVTKHFPREERYGLTQQLRRAGVSVPSNIAEGYGRRTYRQTYNFLENALGSTFELEKQLEIAYRLNLIDDVTFEQLSQRLASSGRGLTALMRYVEREARAQPRRA